MNILFVKQAIKPNIIKRIFKGIQVKEGKIIINCNLSKAKIKKKMKIVKKIKQILNNNSCKNVIISKDLKKDCDFVNLLYSNNIEIIDGRKIFKMYILDIVDYIVKRKKFKMQDCKIAILTNQYNRFVETVIKNLALQCKNLQVVTNHIEDFERLEDKLYNDGVIITVTNNKRKSLLNSNIILNIDFSKEILNMYNIYDKAIIVNFEEEIRIKKKRFMGNVINWYKIGVKEGAEILDVLKKEELAGFDFNEVVECYYFLNKLKIEEVFLEKLITQRDIEFLN